MNKGNLLIESAKDYLNSSELTEIIHKNFDIKTSEITVDKKLSSKIKREVGKYITMFFDIEKCNIEYFINQIGLNIKLLLKYLNIKKRDNVLFVGLGNKDITSDSLGYRILENISVSDNTYKMYKQVEGITNINSLDFIKSMVNLLSIKLVVVFDALKAENFIRLNKTIQMTSCGITPGSAFYKSKTICKKNIGCKVLSIGVPTMIDIKDLVKNIDMENTIVSTKNIDIEIDNISEIISIAINRIF